MRWTEIFESDEWVEAFHGTRSDFVDIDPNQGRDGAFWATSDPRLATAHSERRPAKGGTPTVKKVLIDTRGFLHVPMKGERITSFDEINAFSFNRRGAPGVVFTNGIDAIPGPGGSLEIVSNVYAVFDKSRVKFAVAEAERLTLPDIEVGDEVLVGKFKNRKATVKGFAKDDHNQPVLKTTKGDQKLFKPRLSKLMTEQTLNEGLIAVPPKMLAHITFLLTYHMLWRMRDRFKGIQKKLPEQYAAFKKLVAEFGETLPREPYKLDGSVSVTRIPVSLDGMPPNYHHLKPKAESIFFAIDWRAGAKANGVWRNDKLAVIVYPCTLDYIERYPTIRSHPDDLKIGIDTLIESITHELRHMVQFVLLGDHPEQLKMKADYKSHGADYYTSPVEFDPTIGSAVQEFVKLWNLYGEASSSNVKLSQAVRYFTAMSPAPRFSTFEPARFFVALKKTAPERYRVAVKKFFKHLQANF